MESVAPATGGTSKMDAMDSFYPMTSNVGYKVSIILSQSRQREHSDWINASISISYLHVDLWHISCSFEREDAGICWADNG
jgi:uncharacterized protein YtpQ (UPF0354 family)